jgi:hypothetical protein
MRRIAITVSAALVLLAFAPSGALARHHRYGRHHARHARTMRFGDVNAPTTSSSSDNAGTVQSFNNGVLTIVLNDKSTVSGAVTNDTELECMAPEQSQAVHEDGDGGGGDQSGDGDNQSGDDQGEAAEQNEDQAEDQNEAVEEQNENEAAEENENEAENNCSTDNLTPGTVVREAELRISSAGIVWKKVELEC